MINMYRYKLVNCVTEYNHTCMYLYTYTCTYIYLSDRINTEFQIITSKLFQLGNKEELYKIRKIVYYFIVFP